MSKKKSIILQKNSIKIKVEYHKKKVALHFDFYEKENLEDYIFLLDKIDKWIKSGEYTVSRT